MSNSKKGEINLAEVKFSGKGQDLPLFVMAVQGHLRNSSQYAKECIDYLDPTKFKNADGTDNIPDMYNEKEPVQLDGQTQVAIQLAAFQQSQVSAHNEKVRQINLHCRNAISAHITFKLDAVWLQDDVLGNPRKFMQKMHSLYGAEFRTVLDGISAFYEILNLKMQKNESFSTFYNGRFKLAREAAKLNDEQTLALLCRLPDDIKGCAACLPEPFHVHIVTALRSIKNLSEFIQHITVSENYMMRSSHEDHKKANAISNGQPKVDASKYCVNCFNYGHESPECRLRACSCCKKWDVAHRSHNCNQRHQKKPSQKRPADRKDTDDDDSDASTSSKSSRSSRGSKKGNNNKNGKRNDKNGKGNDKKKPSTPRHKKGKREDDALERSAEDDSEWSDISDAEDDIAADTDVDSDNEFCKVTPLSDEEGVDKVPLVHFAPDHSIADDSGKIEGILPDHLYARMTQVFKTPRELKKRPYCFTSFEETYDDSLSESDCYFSDTESEREVDFDDVKITRSVVRRDKSTKIASQQGALPKKFVKVRALTVGRTSPSLPAEDISASRALLDTGAQATVFQDESLLCDVCSDPDDLPVIHTANGSEMNVVAVGNYNEHITNVHVCPEVTENLLSGEELQRTDHYILLTPHRFTAGDVGGYVLNAQGQIVLTVAKDMSIDLKMYGVGPTQVIDIPWFPHFRTPATSIKEAFRVYGTSKDTTVRDLVRLLHNIGHFSLSDMCAVVKATDNCFVTEDQIRKFFDHNCPVCNMGKLRKRTVKNTQEKKQTVALEDAELVEEKKKSVIFQKELPSMESMVDLRKLEPRNLQIGGQVGIDYQGMILGLSTLNFTDKASGFTISTILKKDGKREVDAAFQSVLHYFAKYGHHSSKWGEAIHEFRMDSDPTFVSKKITALCESNGIKAVYSPADQHELNGLAERKNQFLANMVTCMYAQAPYVPEQLWGVAWLYATMISNLMPCNIPGEMNITRQEAFTGIRPDFKTTPYLPFGTVVQYHLSKEQRGKFKFAPKAAIGIFLMPSVKVAGAISVYSVATKRIVDRRTYRIVSHIPPAWTTISPKYFVFSGSADELKDLDAEEQIAQNEQLLMGNANLTGGSKKEKQNETVVSGGVILSDAVAAPVPTQPSGDGIALPTSAAAAPTTQVSASAALPAAAAAVPVMPTTAPTVETAVAVIPGSTPRSSVQEGATNTATAVANGAETTGNLPNLIVTPAIAPPTPTSTNGRQQRNRKKPKRYANRVFNPILEGLELCMDEELQLAFLTNIKDAPLQVMKVNGKRVRIDNVLKKKERLERHRLKQLLVNQVKKKKKKHDKDNPTLEQAKKRADWPEFQKAMDAELAQLKADDVYEEIVRRDLPPGVTPIGCMWVLTVKRRPDGSIDKYKARLVALGNHQKRDQYDKIKSSTARSSCVKMLISIQAKTAAHSCVLDVKGAFLKAKVTSEKLYLRLPNGQIVRLKRYLYGLKQAGFQWQETLSLTLQNKGYLQSKHDPCIYYLRNKTDFIVMTTHVDDFYVVASKPKLIDDLHGALEQAFGEVSIKTGDILGYLGMQIVKKKSEIVITQPGYLEKILAKSGISENSTAKTPFVENMSESSDDQEAIDKTTYLEHIGMLNYLAVLTRPDILYALSRCAQQCSNPTKRDLRRVMKIYKYLNGTRHFGLTFGADSNLQLNCFVDASHGQYSDGKGHFGYCFSFGPADGAFYARSQKMKIVTPGGSTETEYVAMYEAATEIVFLRNLLNEIGFVQQGPTLLYEDNKSTIDLAHGLGKFQKQKHINIKYHYTKDLVKDGTIQVCYVHTEQMIADMLTKPLSSSQHRYLCSLMLNVKEEKMSDDGWTKVQRKA